MKKMLYAIFGLVAWGLVGQAAALPTLSLLPASQTASSGDSVSLDLVIDGLGDFAPDSLGDFDVDIGYDTAVLSFQSLTLGPFLGDVGLGEAIDFSLGDLVGTVNIAELSLLEPDAITCIFCTGPYLDDIQPGSFTLATLDFHVDALAPGGSTTVSVANVNILGDGFGNLLTLDSTNDAVIRGPQISTPEPTMLALLGLGLFGISVARRSRFKH
jgi:hypothetical protein